jgi:hypothetical protein
MKRKVLKMPIQGLQRNLVFLLGAIFLNVYFSNFIERLPGKKMEML